MPIDIGAFRDIGEPAAGGVETVSIVRLQHAQDARIGNHLAPEGLGDCRDGDVVVGRTDSTAGEDPLRLRLRALQGIDDERDLVRDGLDPPHLHAEIA